MKLSQTTILSSLFLLGTFPTNCIHAQDTDEMYFAVDTDTEDWDFCGLDYTETCPPTISIEQAACEAPLIVYGRVLQAVNGETVEDAVVQIHVDYRSLFFDEPRETIPKWGAGLENTVETSVFFNSSGFFTTWVSGFNDTATDLAPAGVGSTPCGTRSPNSQEELYFFLQSTMDETGTTPITISDNGELSVNFTLSTSILQTGIAAGTIDVFRLIQTGVFNDDNRLQGNCQPVYCCYNPDCSGCDDILAAVSDEYTCLQSDAPTSDARSAFYEMAPGLFMLMTTLALFCC